MNKQIILSYSNFQALTRDILALAKEVMPDKVIYLNFLNDEVQVTLRVSTNETNVHVVEGHTIPVTHAICNTLDYKTKSTLVTEDIRQLDFNDDIKQTIVDLNIKAYLGIPIAFQSGERFGTLCAAHDEARPFDPKDVKLLENIANLFSYYLELEHIAFKDALTSLYNIRFFLNLEDEILNDGGALLMLDLDYFKVVNDQYGHDVGDLVLQELGAKLSSIAKQFKNVYAIRVGGDEFILYLKKHSNVNKMTTIIETLMLQLRGWHPSIVDLVMSVSIGAFVFSKGDFHDIRSLLKKADTLLYQAKQKGRNCYVLES